MIERIRETLENLPDGYSLNSITPHELSQILGEPVDVIKAIMKAHKKGDTNVEPVKREIQNARKRILDRMFAIESEVQTPERYIERLQIKNGDQFRRWFAREYGQPFGEYRSQKNGKVYTNPGRRKNSLPSHDQRLRIKGMPQYSSNQSFTIADVSKYLKINYSSAADLLKIMKTDGDVTKHQKGNEVWFFGKFSLVTKPIRFEAVGDEFRPLPPNEFPRREVSL